MRKRATKFAEWGRWIFEDAKSDWLSVCCLLLTLALLFLCGLVEYFCNESFISRKKLSPLVYELHMIVFYLILVFVVVLFAHIFFQTGNEETKSVSLEHLDEQNNE